MEVSEKYILSSDLDDFVRIQINGVLSTRERGIFSKFMYGEKSKRSFDVELILTCEFAYLHTPVFIRHQPFNSILDLLVKFPVKYCELPLDCNLLINIYESTTIITESKIIIGGTSVKLFKSTKFGIGKKTCRIWEGMEAHHANTPGELPMKTMVELVQNLGDEAKGMVVTHENAEYLYLEKRTNWLDSRYSTHRRNILLNISPIDDLSRKEEEEEEVGKVKRSSITSRNEKSRDCTILLLTVCPYPSHPILYYSHPVHQINNTEGISDEDNDSSPHVLDPVSTMSTNWNEISSSSSSTSSTLLSYHFGKENTVILNRRSSRFRDHYPNFIEENPVRSKYRMLGQHTIEQAYHSVPTIIERSKLEEIIERTHLTPMSKKEKELVWSFRYWLKNARRDSLVKVISASEIEISGSENNNDNNRFFFRCNNYSNRYSEIEITEGKKKELERSILPGWKCGDDLNFCDALELLSYRYEYYPFIREFAVTKILVREKNETIFEILIQLVQSLRYENIRDFPLDESPLGRFLLTKSMESFEIAVHLYFLLDLEIDICEHYNEPKEKNDLYKDFQKKMLESVERREPSKRADIDRMVKFVCYLQQFLISLNKRGLDRDTMTKQFRSAFSEKSLPLDIQSAFPFPFPIDPTIYVTGVVSEKCFFFKSKLRPLCLVLKTADRGELSVIYKIGDDLRQDQAITQTIRMMHHILLNNSLDLKLVPYRILSCELNSGFVEFVPGVDSFHNISQPILSFLSESSKIPESSKLFKKNVRNNFIRSLAGYCVISFILGFGDRHLDNILIIKEGDPSNIGKMFHIDFGYILGVPGIGKRFISPPIKITRLMAEAAGLSDWEKESTSIGGEKKKTFWKFLEFAKHAYVILRKNARLFVTIFLMFLDSKMEQIVLPAHRFNDDMKFTRIRTILDRLQKEMGVKEAEKYIQNEILNNIASLGGSIEDWIHIIGQKFRT